MYHSSGQGVQASLPTSDASSVTSRCTPDKWFLNALKVRNTDRPQLFVSLTRAGRLHRALISLGPTLLQFIGTYF